MYLVYINVSGSLRKIVKKPRRGFTILLERLWRRWTAGLWSQMLCILWDQRCSEVIKKKRNNDICMKYHVV